MSRLCGLAGRVLRQLGYTVLEAANSEEALKMADATRGLLLCW